MGEVWRGVNDYPNYEVSDLGRVRNVTTGHVLTPMWAGRAKVRLSTKPRTDFDVSHLVAETFIGPRPEGGVVMHRDDDPRNNAVSNLRWGTQQDNVHDMIAKGRGGSQVLTTEIVSEIKTRRVAGEQGRALAAIYGISEQRICDIYKGRTTL